MREPPGRDNEEEFNRKDVIFLHNGIALVREYAI